MRVYDTVERDFTVVPMTSRELGLVRLPHHWN